MDCIYLVIDSLNDLRNLWIVSIYLWLILQMIGGGCEGNGRGCEGMGSGCGTPVVAFGTGCYFQPVPKKTLGTG